MFSSDFDNHLGTVQSDLDTLKDMLRSDSYQFDANTLLGVRKKNARLS